MASTYYTLTRFGYWNDVSSQPAPPAEFNYLTAMWHYARGIALAHQGEIADAWKEHQALIDIANGDILGGPSLSARGRPERPSSPYQKDTKNMVRLAGNAMAGEIAATEKKWEDAIKHLEKAVNLQDNLAYTEPSPWHYPMRHSLGAVLLDAGRPEQAEDVCRDDLRMWPANGWSLYGLMRSLRAQGRMDEARLLEKQYLKAFARADVALTATRF